MTESPMLPHKVATFSLRYKNRLNHAFPFQMETFLRNTLHILQVSSQNRTPHICTWANRPLPNGNLFRLQAQIQKCPYYALGVGVDAGAGAGAGAGAPPLFIVDFKKKNPASAIAPIAR